MVSNFYAEHKHELKTERGWNLAKRKTNQAPLVVRGLKKPLYKGDFKNHPINIF